MPRNRKTTLNKKIKTEIRTALQEELEDKVAVIGLTNQAVPTSAIPTGNVGTTQNFIRLMPKISQGDGQYNNRIGNEIRLKYVDIKMLLNFVQGENESTYKDSAIGVRVMILRQKDQNSDSGLLSDFQGDKLLENGLITAAGPSNFSGTTLNLVQKINREQFSVRYDKVHYMANNRVYNTAGTNMAFNSPPRPVVIDHRLTFGKLGLKLTFGNAASLTATNFPYIMVIGLASSLSSAAPSNSLIEFSYSANASYTDA